MEEFVRLTTPPDADKGEDGGYGVGVYSEENLAGSLSKGKVALLASDGSQVTSLNVGYKQNYDFAPTTQYREYEDGSVYYKGEETFANEHLKVIGKTYDGKEYTGELKNRRTALQPSDGRRRFRAQTRWSFPSVPIPQNTKPHGNLYAGRRGPKDEAIYAKTGQVPNQTSIATSDTYLSAVDATKNYWAFADGSSHGEIGDWAYFVNGDWVEDWSGLFNNQLRAGYTTIEGFLAAKQSAANEAIGNVDIYLNGRG
ncbi:MAG: hypothetical protein ACLR06_11980 [Christensenellaceae bacterium]